MFLGILGERGISTNNIEMVMLLPEEFYLKYQKTIDRKCNSEGVLVWVISFGSEKAPLTKIPRREVVEGENPDF